MFMVTTAEHVCMLVWHKLLCRMLILRQPAWCEIQTLGFVYTDTVTEPPGRTIKTSRVIIAQIKYITLVMQSVDMFSRCH